jgi:hypothetical protein
MKVFKVRFHWHNKNTKKHGWAVVLAPDENLAIEFAKRDVISKVPGYAYVTETKEICTVKDKCTYIDGDFIPISLSMYNKE